MSILREVLGFSQSLMCEVVGITYSKISCHPIAQKHLPLELLEIIGDVGDVNQDPAYLEAVAEFYRNCPNPVHLNAYLNFCNNWYETEFVPRFDAQVNSYYSSISINERSK
jgi:hypothetical protein